MAEINIRYLQDTDGERYFPMTHVDAIVGLSDFDDSGEIENLETLIKSMRVTISSLQTSNAKLITDLNTANQQIEQNKLDIQALQEQIIPPEEGE
ncbi:hypothetical protein G6W75_09850 [Staphylococcus sciuri]|jgi:hypothetical protein|uniref:hypothetical protein n=1 Tax=Mammaliicoccus sciuri TaxID=1296 RepID=UPI0013E95FD4|nr:hypothetical protein [Mammaliicoccus sciuri]NGX76392.1 hypothetical protein [Mammaliicoccus sciuri]